MRRSEWNASNSKKVLRKPPGGSASWTRCGKSRSFVRPTISRLRRVIFPNPRRPPPSAPRSRILHLQPVGRAAQTLHVLTPGRTRRAKARLSRNGRLGTHTQSTQAHLRAAQSAPPRPLRDVCSAGMQSHALSKGPTRYASFQTCPPPQTEQPAIKQLVASSRRFLSDRH